VTSSIKKLKLAIKMTGEYGPWGLTRLSKTASAYKQLTKATWQHTIVVKIKGKK
jgi:hypothetical protein